MNAAMSIFKEQVKHIRRIEWQDKSVVFLFGDYRFLGKLMNISGAKGNRPCIWGEITQIQMQMKKSDWPFIEKRTLHRLKGDHD